MYKNKKKKQNIKQKKKKQKYVIAQNEIIDQLHKPLC